MVVRDEDERDAHGALDLFQLHLHLFAQLLVQCAERFVQQQHLRAQDQGAGQGHALALAAG